MYSCFGVSKTLARSGCLSKSSGKGRLLVVKYALGDVDLEKLESEARKAQRGIWADPQPVPPWEWRKRN